MNNCQDELAWLVSKRLRAIKKPIMKTIVLGPYLSKAQPLKGAAIEPSAMRAEKTAEVVARVKLNSFANDLKKTPNEVFVPITMAYITKSTINTTQP